MTTAKPIGTTHGLDLFEYPDKTITVYRGSVIVGHAFPAIIADPDGAWYGRFRTQDGVRFGGRHRALAYVVGGCPDCVCTPNCCGVSGGEHCKDVGCRYCLSGCPAGECDMTKENET